MTNNSHNGAYPILDAHDYLSVLRHVGEKVEITGNVYDVFEGTTQYGNPYIFLNFGDWRGKIVKLAIWAAVLKGFPDDQWPSVRWKGLHISAIGTVQPPYQSPQSNHPHITVKLESAQHIFFISEPHAVPLLGIDAHSPMEDTSYESTESPLFYVCRRALKWFVKIIAVLAIILLLKGCWI